MSQDRPVGPPVFHANLFAVAISPDGSLLATGDGSGSIQLWLAESGEPILPRLKHPGVVWRLEFSPDGSQLLSGGGTRSSVLWDVTTGTPIGTPLRERSSVHTIGFHPTGTRVLTGGEDGSVRLWDLAPNESVGRAIEHNDPIVAAGYSVDGLRILTESHNGYQLRDAPTGQAIGPSFSLDSGSTLSVLHRQVPDEGTTQLTFSPDGAQVLIGTGCSDLHDVATGRAVGAPYIWIAGNSVRCAAFSPDGTRILVGDINGPARLWDNWRLDTIGPPLPHQASSVAFSPDGSRFVTGSYDGTTQIWDADTLQAIGEPWLHQSEVKALAWSPDGAFLLIGFADGTARLWEIETRTAVGVPLQHRNVLCSVAFSPDGSRMLTCSLDETAQLWDKATGEPIGPTIRPGLMRPTACFSPDGTEILFTGFDGPPRVWKTPPGPLMAVEARRITTWTEVVTGLKMDQRGGIDALDGPTCRQHHQRLHELGGAPTQAPLPPPSLPAKTSRSIELALKGRRQAEQGRWDQALATFAMALRDDASSVTLHHQIAVWSGLLAEEQFKAAKYERCAQLSRYAASLLEELGDQFLENCECRDALAWCYVLHERSLRIMGREAEANKVRYRIVAMFPEDLRDRHNVARASVVWGTYLKRWYRPTREVGKELAIATALLRAEIEEAEHQPQLKRMLAQAHQLLGTTHAFAGRVDEAKASYQRLLQIYPDYHYLHLLLSQLLLSQPQVTTDDVQAALKHAQAAMDAFPDNNDALETFGIACYRAGDYAAAVKALKNARSQRTITDRRNAIRWCYLAMAHGQLGQQEQATDAYRQATDIIKQCGFNSDTIRRLDAETAELLRVRREG
jgi:WD40 repeat protein/tetratricopeptide (TPR) repeat protein